MPSKGNSSSGSGKEHNNQPDISRLWKATPTRIPNSSSLPVIIPHQNEAKADKINWRYLGGFASVLFIVIFAIYAFSLNGLPIFNDKLNLQALTRSFDASVFWPQQVTNLLAYPLTQPFVRMTYALDAFSFPKQPAWYHLVNVSLHAMSTIYLFLFLFQVARRLKAEERFLGNPYVYGLATSLLFACHPLATGAVAYISGRGPILVTCNYFLVLNLFMLGFYAQSSGRIVTAYIVGLLFFFIGLTCGAQMLSLPLVLVIMALLLKPQQNSWNMWFVERWQDFGAMGLYFVGAFIALLTTRSIALDNGVDLNQLPTLAFAATGCKAIITYFFRCFFVPAGLSIEPDFVMSDGFSDPLSILGALSIVLGLIAVFFTRRKPLLAISLTVAFTALIPDLLFVQHEYVSDQRYYLSLAGLCIALSTVVYESVGHLITVKNRRSYGAGVLALLVLLSGLTIWRETAWVTPRKLWSSNRSTMSARALAQLGQTVLDKGRIEEGRSIEFEALKKDPDCPGAHEALATVAMAMHQYGAAASEFTKAVTASQGRKTAPERIADLQRQAAQACIKNSDWLNAQKFSMDAIHFYPGNSDLHLYVGQALLGQHQAFPAMQEIQTAYDLSPVNPWVLEPMIEAMLDVGGTRYLKTAYQMARKSMSVMLSNKSKLLFARAALNFGRLQAAVPRIQVVLAEEPKNAEALFLMSYAMHLAGNEQRAAELKKQAVAIQPDIEKFVVMHPEKDDSKAAAKASGAPVQATPGIATPLPKPIQSAAPELKH